jgi:hypothetical protein
MEQGTAQERKHRHDALLGLAWVNVDGRDLKDRRSATDVCEREGRIELGRPSEVPVSQHCGNISIAFLPF